MALSKRNRKIIENYYKRNPNKSIDLVATTLALDLVININVVYFTLQELSGIDCSKQIKSNEKLYPTWKKEL
jgi:hypothetical protein